MKTTRALSPMMPTLSLLVFGLALASTPSRAQYNKQAGRSAPRAEPAPAADAAAAAGEGAPAEPDRRAKAQEVARDSFGNANGTQYDLAVDGAFEGQTILIIDYYTKANGQDFSGPIDAVRTKGFSMVRYAVEPPVAELEKLLAKSNQLWIIASCDDRVHLTPAHQAAVRAFFDAGHGVYLWGDNDPCNADADALAQLLVGARVKGDLPGDQTVRISSGPGKPGVTRDHLLTTGVENVYEGVTVATVASGPNEPLTPIIWGSAGNLVTAAYERKAKRLLIDGGFTRLSYKWNTAGTGRYIKNAAAWLANYERFGDQVAAKSQPQP